MTTASTTNTIVVEVNREWFQIIAILTSCLTSLSFGLSLGWTSPSIPILISPNSAIAISFEDCSYFPIIQACALMLTCPVLAILVEIIGRKKCVLFLSCPYLISWILIATANSAIMLYISRLCAGVGDAGVFTVLPMYIGEVAEPKVRGVWGNGVGLGSYLGQFIVNTIGAYLSIPLTAIICALVPVIHLIIFSFMPESPYYLLMKGKKEEARLSLQKLRWRRNVDDELSSLEHDVKRQISEKGSMKDLFCNKVNRQALLIAIGLRIAQQICGQPAFVVYTQYLFEEAGGNISKSTSSIIYTATFVIITTCSMLFMDKLGRRISMIISSIGCGLSLFALSVYCYISSNKLMGVSNVNWFPLFGMIVWLLFAGCGLGLVPLLMLSELFSASIKGKAVNIVCIAFAIAFLSVTKIFQTLASNFGLFAPFAFFGVCCLIILTFSYFYVPETKGKTLEEIQQVLRNKNVKNTD